MGDGRRTVYHEVGPERLAGLTEECNTDRFHDFKKCTEG